MTNWSFRVLSGGNSLPAVADKTVFLIQDNWNDFGFVTLFSVHATRIDGSVVEIGSTKIARFGMHAEEISSYIRTELPIAFPALPGEFFSVGQDPSYYENWVSQVGRGLALELLSELQDLAAKPERLKEVLGLDVAAQSLFRFISPSTVRDQYARILEGGPTKDGFSITYRTEDTGGDELEFVITPGSLPPSNVHVLIGPNGSGKTRALRRIRASFDERLSPSGYLNDSDWSDISNLVSVSFSAFDPFPDQAMKPSTDAEYRTLHIGLEREAGAGEPMKSAELTDAFSQVVNDCTDERRELLSQIFRFLETDPTLGRLRVSDLKGLHERLQFKDRSSGHKIVLLTLANLVRWVNEKTLVLIDEPEAHLHPPLLSAFMRALSWLMSEQNGLAIVATHSPVVLQEVPAKCAYVFWSSGESATVTKPRIETFGENLGVLTREVFHFEIDKAGFHTMLKTVAEESEDLGSALAKFDNHLGEEAIAILRGMIARKERQG